MSETKKKSYEERAAAEPTQLHKDFAQWIYEETGIRPDLKSVQLACALRMDYQRSEANQSSLAERKAEAARKKQQRAQDKRARLEAQLAKLQQELAEETAEPMPAAKPAPRKAVAAKAPSKAATPTRKATAAKVTEKAPTQPRAARTRRTVAAKKTAPKAFDSVPETDK